MRRAAPGTGPPPSRAAEPDAGHAAGIAGRVANAAAPAASPPGRGEGLLDGGGGAPSPPAGRGAGALGTARPSRGHGRAADSSFGQTGSDRVWADSDYESCETSGPDTMIAVG